MSSTLDRLRRLQSLRSQRARPELVYVPLEDEAPAQPAPTRPLGRLEELVSGVELGTDAGVCYLVTEAFPLAVPRGFHTLGDLLQLSPSLLAPFHPDFSLHEHHDFTQAAFIDTETTGLGGGAGVYAFMVGVGTFERVASGEWRVARGEGRGARGEGRGASGEAHIRSDDFISSDDFSRSGERAEAATHFVVRQFFMRHPGEEAAVLAAVAELLDARQVAVTFNGRSFDLPLLRTRYLQNQRLLPAQSSVAILRQGAPHLDLLYPARRLWRRRLQSCRLINLEQVILGLQRSEEDVPGSLIPALYQDYVRSGHAGEMSRVFYHNREDIVSMVALAHRLIQAYAQPGDAEAGQHVQAEDWLALGICYADRGELVQAEAAYRRAIDAIVDDRRRAEAYARLGEFLKRQARWAEAAAIWELWLTSVPGVDPTPYVELAKVCEWQIGDLAQAEMWTAWALHDLRAAPVYQRLPGQVAGLEHRLERLRRKQAK